MKKIDLKAKYFETNEWAREESDGICIGITDFAQTVFGKVVFVEIEKVGKLIERGDKIAIIESDKTATEILSPLSGKIIATNESLDKTPELLNDAPYKEGWLIKIELGNVEEWENLMDANAYKSYMHSFYNKI